MSRHPKSESTAFQIAVFIIACLVVITLLLPNLAD